MQEPPLQQLFLVMVQAGLQFVCHPYAGADQQIDDLKAPTGSCGRYVLKRVFTERGARVRLAGLREAYFGRLLQRSSASVIQVAVTAVNSKHEILLKQICLESKYCLRMHVP